LFCFSLSSLIVLLIFFAILKYVIFGEQHQQGNGMPKYQQHEMPH